MFSSRLRVILPDIICIVSFTATALVAQELPQQISDKIFWQMISEFSEPDGYFRSDNFISNETAFQQVIPALQRDIKPGGAYLGVGPDQNFTYVVALKPKIAFIVDIRRQNMLQHLLYKAIIELSRDRADFLSLLFSRTRPEKLTATSTANELVTAYANAPGNRILLADNVAAVRDQLMEHHGFALEDDDLQSILYIHEAFFRAGPDITYSFPNAVVGGRIMPTYSELMTQTDGEQNRSYIASEQNFQFLKEMETKNLIVHVVGDFGGPKELRAVGQYLRDHDATLSVMYTSNVEQYLFDSDAWLRFYPNIETFPMDSTSTFIRSSFNIAGGRLQNSIRSLTMLCPIEIQMKAFDEGQIVTYMDVLRMSRLP
jgi:hypothetical protein